MELNWKSIKDNLKKFTNMWTLSNTLLNDQWIKEEIMGNQEIFSDKYNIPEFIR